MTSSFTVILKTDTVTFSPIESPNFTTFRETKICEMGKSTTKIDTCKISGVLHPDASLCTRNRMCADRRVFSVVYTARSRSCTPETGRKSPASACFRSGSFRWQPPSSFMLRYDYKPVLAQILIFGIALFVE